MLPAAHGGPYESVVIGEVGSLRPPPVVRPGILLSNRAGRGCLVGKLHTAGHPSQSSVARLAACARQLCGPGYY